jgi:type I restriction enzyme R subunit
MPLLEGRWPFELEASSDISPAANTVGNVTDVNLQPEQEARVLIDQMLRDAGWVVQKTGDVDLTASRGVAVREFQTANGPVDYLLYVDRKPVGTIEAKKAGETLRSVEWQSNKYVEGFEETAKQKGIAAWALPLPFHYLSTGTETLFSSRLDPIVRPRRVFHFHRPETLLEWVTDETVVRQRLRQMPPLAGKEVFRDIQIDAVLGLEASFRDEHLRTLVPMATGAGKTFTAVSEAYRLLRHAKAKRILFLVDRRNLGKQAADAFTNYVTPDDGRKFGELYVVQHLKSNKLDPAAKVVITTIQRLYSILQGKEEFDESLEDESAFELESGLGLDSQLPVSYQPKLPPEWFDFIFTDECHRSIYGRWGQVLDYFDSFLVGLTATPSAFTYGYFNGNIVAEYTYEQSVIDEVNVDFNVYRIETEITGSGSAIEKGEWAKVRDRMTRGEVLQEMDDDVLYVGEKLDRDVVSPDQIRMVIRTFRDKLLTEIFPGRKEVPKTVFFCKNDSHAEDVLEAVREIFARGQDFARKITYKSQGSSDQLIQDFRTDPRFRIAVTVDQVSTGTDIKPLECLVFMRMVKSRSLFEQMKGRGVRTVDSDTLQAVTPDTRVKDHFVIVDCVGVTDDERAWAETKPLDRKPTVPLKNLLANVSQGATSDDIISSLGARLVRLNKKLDADERAELERLAGTSVKELAGALIGAADKDKQIAQARAAAGLEADADPTEEQVTEARFQLVEAAVEPLLKSELRQKIEELQARVGQLIDLTSRDKLVFAGYRDKGAAKEAVRTFKEFIDEHHDQYVALKAYYEQPHGQRISLEDIKALAKAIETPPLYLTTEKIWAAYKALEGAKVRGSGQRVLTDLVSLIRFTLEQDDELVPHPEIVRFRFDTWVAEQEASGRKFSPEEMRWLEMVRDHIATSMTMELDDFDLDPFNTEGGLTAAYEVFGNDLNPLIEQLNEVLVA